MCIVSIRCAARVLDTFAASEPEPVTLRLPLVPDGSDNALQCARNAVLVYLENDKPFTWKDVEPYYLAACRNNRVPPGNRHKNIRKALAILKRQGMVSGLRGTWQKT